MMKRSSCRNVSITSTSERNPMMKRRSMMNNRRQRNVLMQRRGRSVLVKIKDPSGGNALTKKRKRSDKI